MGWMHQEVFFTNITSGIIKDMKIELRNKWSQNNELRHKLDTSIYQDLMKNSWHKLDLLRSMISEFSYLNFNPWWHGLQGFHSLNL